MDFIMPNIAHRCHRRTSYSYLLYRSRPPQQMAAMADYSTVDSDWHLVYLFCQSYCADEAGCPAGADCRSRNLHLLNVRQRQNTRMQPQCRCNFSNGPFKKRK